MEERTLEEVSLGIWDLQSHFALPAFVVWIWLSNPSPVFGDTYSQEGVSVPVLLEGGARLHPKSYSSIASAWAATSRMSAQGKTTVSIPKPSELDRSEAMLTPPPVFILR